MSESTSTPVIPVRAGNVDDNPYVGPRTFQLAQADRFFGREREARELLAVVSAERLTLFYAQSGAGKSSLLNTRLIPGLQAKGFEVLPVGRVGGADMATFTANPFVFNLMRSLLPPTSDPSHFADLTLTDFLARLVFAEEAYTLLDAPLPEPVGVEVIPIPRVLVIDQFEEILTTQLTAWAQRGAFFDQLAAALTADPYLWVVLTLREDYVAGLDPYAHRLPTGFRARYYMQRMGRAAALDAVRRPAGEIGQRPFAPGVAEQLVDNLRLVQNIWRDAPAGALMQGEFVEPVQLQVVCYQLWEGLQGVGRTRDGKAKATGNDGDSEYSGDGQQAHAQPPRQTALTPRYITESDLKRLAGERPLVAFVNQALADYYEQAVERVVQSPGFTLGARMVRDWFSTQLITAQETRGLVNQGENESGGLPNPAIKLLTDLFLIRAESRAGGIWYELTHDRFVQPILQANRDWEAKQNNPLTAVTRLWLENGRDPARLIKAQQLIDAQRYATAQEAMLTQEERDFLRFSIQDEQDEQDDTRQAARRRRNLVVGGIIVVLLFALLALWGFDSANEAEVQAAEAVVAKSTAIAASNSAATRAVEASLARATAVAESTRSAIAVVTAEAALDRAESQSQIARSRQLAAQTLSELSNNRYEPAILLAIEAGRAADTREAFAAIRAAIANPWHSRALFEGHTGPVYQATWSADEGKILTASADNTVRIWDAASADELVQLTGHTGPVWQATWSADEGKILTASADNTVRIWYVPMEDLIDAACQWVPRNMTATEWRLYLEGAYRPTCPTVNLPLAVIATIQADSARLIQQGEFISATQQLDQLNGWLKENGQWQSLGITPTQLMVEQAAELAQSGEITAAVTTYQAALHLDPTLPITPAVEANRQYASVVVEQAKQLAWRDEITAAVASYQAALRLDPTLPISPTEEAERQAGFVEALKVGHEVTGTVTVSSGDPWRFTAKAGQTLTITANATAEPFDMVITLYAPDATALVSQDSGSDGREVIEGIMLPATGIYIINVSEYNGGSGSYTLEVK